MKKRMIGKSGLEASVIAMGSWAIGGGSWWGDNDDALSIRTIHQALDGGINLVDTAPVYGFGHSEEVVGKAIKDRRSQTLLSTKCGLWWQGNEGTVHFEKDGHTVRRNLTAVNIKTQVELSLKRLQTDYIDIYFTHWQAVEPMKTPISETMQALMELKKEGKIRAIGVSNATVAEVEEYQKYGQVDIMQEKFSILDRRVEPEILPFCEKNGITLQAYSPIEQGLLTGKIGLDYEISPDSARYGKLWWKMEHRQAVLDMLAGWDELCKKYDCSLTNLAINWIWAQGELVNVLCGARKTDQIAEILNTGKMDLESADVLRMTAGANRLIAQAAK